MKKMKTILCSGFAAALVGGIVLSTTVFAEDKAPAVQPATEVAAIPSAAEAKITLSFSQGHMLGGQLLQAGDMIDHAEFLKGLKAALAEQENPHSQPKIQAAMKVLQEAEMKKQATKDAENLKVLLKKYDVTEADLKTTASGLKYKVLTAGAGTAPVATDQVECHYTGFLTNGTKFDSSVDRGQTATFPLNGVIPGWTEGLQLMKPGAKFLFVIPSDLGYGPRGSGRTIPPNATLVFEVELIKVVK